MKPIERTSRRGEAKRGQASQMAGREELIRHFSQRLAPAWLGLLLCNQADMFTARRDRDVMAVQPERHSAVIVDDRHLAGHADSVAFSQLRCHAVPPGRSKKKAARCRQRSQLRRGKISQPRRRDIIAGIARVADFRLSQVISG